MDLTELLVGKPIKSENNTYVCPIYYETRKQAFVMKLPGSVILDKKHYNGQNFLVIKNPAYLEYFSDLNDKIIDVVKKNCSLWFNNNMSLDLVDDYFVRSVVWDKKHGDVLKLKYTNLEEFDTKVKCDLVVTLTNLRFYKQKFLLEFSVDHMDIISDFIKISDNAEEVEDLEETAAPTAWDIDLIKTKGLGMLEERLQTLERELVLVKNQWTQLKNAKDAELILKLQEELV
jgi:hypothetical protein